MLQFEFLPTLEASALFSIAVELWKQSDIIKDLKFLFIYCPESSEDIIRIRMNEIEEKVQEKIAHLFVPALLKAKVEVFVHQTGLQITRWIGYNISSWFPFKCMLVEYIDSLHWTSRGTIDQQKTAALILEKSKYCLTPQIRYELACCNCLQDYVHLIWKDIPNNHGTISKYNLYQNYRHLMDVDKIFAFWTFCNNGEMEKFHRSLRRYSQNGVLRNTSINDYFVKWSVKYDNIVAFKYFWERLTQMEKDANIISCAIKSIKYYDPYCNDNKEIFCYLVKEMNEIQVKEMFEHNADDINYFLFKCTGWQYGFLFPLEDILKFISTTGYKKILLSIVKQMNSKSFSKYNYRTCQMAFREVWTNSPPHLQHSIFETIEDIWEILSTFLKAADFATLEFILKIMTDEERENIVTLSVNLDECYGLFLHDKSPLKYFLAKQIFFPITEVNEYIQQCRMLLSAAASKKEIRLLLEIIVMWYKSIR